MKKRKMMLFKPPPPVHFGIEMNSQVDSKDTLPLGVALFLTVLFA